MRPRGARTTAVRPVVPGEILPAADPVPLNPGRPVVVLEVRHTGDRVVHVGSHVHFPAVNDTLQFDRAAAHGHRLDVPAGTTMRFEPGTTRVVRLVPLGGGRVVAGLDPGGPLDLDVGAAAGAVAL